MAEEKDFRREELPGKYMAKILYGWNNGKFEEEYCYDSRLKVLSQETTLVLE